MKKTLLSFLTLWILSGAWVPDAAAQLPDVKSLDGDPVHTLLQPDGIPSIDNPEFVPGSEADFMKKNEMVIGVVHDGIAKAYSVWHLDRHEIVNDVVGDDPLAVTW